MFYFDHLEHGNATQSGILGWVAVRMIYGLRENQRSIPMFAKWLEFHCMSV